MTAKRKVVWGLWLLTGIAAAGYLKFSWIRSHVSMPGAIARLGRILPPLPVFDDAGKGVDAATSCRGSRCVIVFYSSSCRVCQEVLSLLNPFPPELRLVLIHTRSESSPRSSPASELTGASVYFDRNDVFSRSFWLSGVPAILFVDERGVLRDGLVGKHSLGRLRRKLQAFAEGKP
jgi:hypothetical protein